MTSRFSFHRRGRAPSDSIETPRLVFAEALSVEGLRDAVPAEYQTWVRSAVLVCVFAYAVTTAAIGLEVGFGQLYLRQELHALVFSLLGLLLERRGKPMVAAYWVLLVVAAEAAASFYLSPDGLRSAALPALPVIVLGSGLFLGPRAAYGFALATSIAAPFMVWLSDVLGHGPGLGPGATIGLAALFMSQMATAVVLHVFLRSFGRIFARARANEQRAADLLEAASDGLLVVSPDGRVEACNDRAASSLGLAREELSNLEADQLPLRLVERESGRFVLSDLTWSEASQEYRAKKTGLALEARAKKVRSGDQRGAWLLLLRDITAQLEAKEREAELSRQVQHSQKLEAIGKLAGGVAHDFNNLLTVVAGYADFIDDLSDEGAPEIAEELRVTCQRGVGLTRKLLAFARREVIAPIPLDVSEVVRGLRNLLSRILGERISIQIEMGSVSAIEADPGQVEQLIINLATNAREAMPEGGDFRIRVLGTRDHVILEIADTGVGIDEVTRGRIFEPFFTTKPRGKGTGLGLATVHGIVSQSGGRIVVDSKVDEGSLFRIVWPSTTRPLPGPHRSTHGSPPPTGEGVILLAEDDERARKMIVRMLEDAGFDVLVAQDGAEALSIAVELGGAPDLILTDIVMPNMSGVELLERVQAIYPSIRYLLMSGYTDQQLSPERHDLSEALLHKPFGRMELLDRLATILPVAKRKLAQGALPTSGDASRLGTRNLGIDPL